LRLCGFARGNLHTLATVTADDPAHPIHSFRLRFFRAKAQRRKVFKNLEIPIFRPSHKAQMNPPNLIFLSVFAALREAIFTPRQL
jgi:hypothetical protein